jgi:glycosyltransferase involved in cell wall biosynthesis
MTDGFGILLPTYNMLDYLKLCLKSLEKHSKLANDIVIVDDGSGDGTSGWLQKNMLHILPSQNSQVILREKHKGCFSSYNIATMYTHKPYVFMAQDDFYFLPDWDINLAKWLEELSDEYMIATQILEPFRGSYVYHDCGDGPAGRPFDEEKALQYVLQNSKHTLKPQAFSMFAILRDDWMAVRGFSEEFDPVASGTRDFQMKLHKLKPRKWVIAEDVYVYHFKPQGRIIPYRADQSHAEDNIRYFKQKWGVTIEGSEQFLGGS